MRSKILITLLLITVSTATFAQGLRIAAYNRSLNKVLTELGVEVSFDSRALSAYNITIDKTFDSPQQAIEYLLRGKPFVYERVGNVYVISSKPQVTTPIPPKQEYVLSGILIDSENEEVLPYGRITTSIGTFSSNDKGFFSVRKTDNSPVNIRVEYLGYSPLDTILTVGSHKIILIPQPISIGEVTVTSSPDLMTMQSGERSGDNHINHNVARYMPGSGDNSVFTLLRMMPGVRASGEASEELIVWGDNSRITFDGFTLFGMRGFNDNISFVNPYMVKDIRLMKGGYDASYGGQSGGIAEITGMNGKTSKPSLKANISTLTANIYASLPVSKRSSLSVAYRQTFYDLYESELLNPYNGKRPSYAGSKGGGSPQQNTSEIFITPDYGFRDMNIKYSGEASVNDSYYISLYGADDKFDFTVQPNVETKLSAHQKSRQYGGVANYNRVWSNGSTTKLLLNFSQLNNDDEHITITPSGQKPPAIYEVDNFVREMGAKLSHDLNLGEHNKIEIGGEANSYVTRLNSREKILTVPSIYAIDNLNICNFSADFGVRADFAYDKIYIQPRISLRHKLSDKFTVTASWGLYNQYLNRIPIEIEADKIAFAWQLKDASQAMHSVAGLAYSDNGFLASIECFAKQTTNAKRLIEGEITTTDVNLWGADLFLKKNFSTKATLFGSYSFLRTTYPMTESGHEVKLGGLYSLKHLVFSANYVYGTGFSTLSQGGLSSGRGQGQGANVGMGSKSTVADKPYSRFDIAVTYRHNFKSCKLQAGFSVVNLFDTENIKYSYGAGSKNDPVAIYSQAMPFTPMLFVEILF